MTSKAGAKEHRYSLPTGVARIISAPTGNGEGTPGTRRKTKGIAMIKNTIYRAAVIGASAVLASSAVAQANPGTPMPVIESSAAQLCAAIDGNPTDGGVFDGMASLQNRGA